MKSSDFKDFLKTLFPDYSYKLGRTDEGAKKEISLYIRSGVKTDLFYNEAPSSLLPLTLIISISGNYAESEKEVFNIYDKIVNINCEKYNGFTFSVFPYTGRLPVYLGYKEDGAYQFSIDIDIINNK